MEYFEQTTVAPKLLKHSDINLKHRHITMEILIGIKGDMRKIGFLPFNHPNSELINIAQYFLFLAIFLIKVLSSLWFFIFKADIFIEYIESSMPICVGFFIILAYCNFMWQGKKIHELIMKYESLIVRRKSI